MNWILRIVTRPLRVHPFINQEGKWQWHIKSPNGEILAHSEEYSSRQACYDTVNMLTAKRIVEV
jgi:uncharacterized protein YegP (UPF0339 family)